MNIHECIFPDRSLIANEIISADFHDSFRLLSLEGNLDPLDIYLIMVNNTPSWINRLLSLRNKLVHLLGLNDVGNLGAINGLDFVDRENLIGEKLDIFIIESFSKNEMILTQKDKHLDIKISILKHENSLKTDLIVSTVVNFHNKLGKIYMTLIAPFHKVVVKRLMKNVICKK
ncbi:MAG: DUF2867 domain-containing protein [Gammaproteobacteria bacterium]